MRHGKKINHLGRQAGHRRALLANLGVALITHKRIKTTTAKAKALQRYIEPILTKSKEDTTTSRRTAFKYLQDKEAVSELFRSIGPKIAERPGGYTRIIKLGFRQGDAADIALIELVDYNELYDISAKKKTRRSRKSSSTASQAPKAEKKADSSEE
ncbi:50S ribosomal protein L17 [Ornithobacterium rhinotracheale]|uniref:Large ribosomal subunit protein bL17 n=1 Tax=Ornithobacterium rhinotracheale (strain ATCC 51463 / DSM 15997 / CCUG 23171 / CIP 104009 / LMG 9086) TaxID=867902 RepID=I3ZY70_ORNRL|nr:50S ribosomal protein L17 [Ornithobacterium rhinotracheale]AFL96654.1 ribosomal protein L17 [Ornithobacterium rhinotracheale DSM 15997]AIP99549.1 50S ribosomal protein L17 [Ornithobacterium rhinotracheale ORT-UMN 88]KGB66555.1 50S ribosomal protein L17 [Ornithobacterium rhinotracheale H06-030791]MBN3662562.1 50S ribosomal protein L17 [Ornithobacterium rhinotracheale]MCK0194003.1 50S ribosomal protein L17 [Ornithobacterium rhinotracheale]